MPRSILRIFPVAACIGGLAFQVLIVGSCSDNHEGSGEGKGGRNQLLFGVATSGFQVDMGCPTLSPAECDDSHSDWYQFVTSPEMIKSPFTFLSGQDPAKVGPGHWELYEADFDLAAEELHLNAFRMSIEWSRIFLTSTIGIEGYENLRAVANQAALVHYHKVFDALHARGLKPLVTLHHYTLPTWIHDGNDCHCDVRHCSPRGWLDKDVIVAEIAKYAGFIAREFGDQVDLWATLNEPFAVLLSGYLLPSPERSNPPALLLQAQALKTAYSAMIEAHARMYDAIKVNDTADADGDGIASQVGIAYAMSPVSPKNPERSLDTQAAENIFYIWNMAFLNAVLFGEFDQELDGHAVKREDLSGRMDYMGINYYARITVEGTERSIFPQLSPLLTFNPLTLAYDVYPRGLYEMSEFVYERTGLPIHITENNGQNDPQDTTEKEIDYMREFSSWLSYAMDRGIDIRGYFYWSLMDNFEWNRGMKPYGLYEVDPLDPTKARRPRPTANVLAQLAAEARSRR